MLRKWIKAVIRKCVRLFIKIALSEDNPITRSISDTHEMDLMLKSMGDDLKTM